MFVNSHVERHDFFLFVCLFLLMFEPQRPDPKPGQLNLMQIGRKVSQRKAFGCTLCAVISLNIGGLEIVISCLL